jgi:hypothetical protein
MAPASQYQLKMLPRGQKFQFFSAAAFRALQPIPEVAATA